MWVAHAVSRAEKNVMQKGQGDYSKIKLGIENGFKWDEFTPNFLCIRSKRMEGEKPSKIKTIKLIRLLVNRKNYLI